MTKKPKDKEAPAGAAVPSQADGASAGDAPDPNASPKEPPVVIEAQ